MKNTMSHPWNMAWFVSIFMTLTAVHTQREKTKRIFSLVFATAKAGSVQNGHQQTSLEVDTLDCKAPLYLYREL